MTAQNDLDRTLDTWLGAQAASAPPPEPLLRILETTRGRRPRPALLAGIGSHWVDRGARTGVRGGMANLRPALIIVLVALLALALVGAVLLAGSRLLAPKSLPIPHTDLLELVSAAGLSRPMAGPVLAQLQDGRVLVMGAGSHGEDQTPSAELYDPEHGTSVAVGPMVPVPWVHSATRLMDGRVLVIGGEGVAQIFDPATMRFVPAGAMVSPRPDTVATLLHDGRVLVIGLGLSAELFNPDTLTFSETGSMAATPVEAAAIATLPDGRVFVPAGVQTIPDTEWAIEAEIYDPGTRTFSAAGRMPDFGVVAAIALADGRVLVVGSVGMSGENRGRAAIWDPATRAFSRVADPPGRVSIGTMLDDGRILLLGFVQFPRDRAGCQVGTQHACTWAGIYDLATGATTLVTPPTAWAPSVVRLADGRVLVVGGTISGEIGPAPDVNDQPAVSTVQIFQ